jgi:TetR/AcrR family transcriptional repressor of nem operon
MRVSREEMARTHQSILAEATRMLRQRGIEKTGVNDVMQACGLTHGGFYRHFASKDALVAEAIRMAFQEIFQHFDRKDREIDPSAAVDAYVDQYLSYEHVRSRDFGCPVAAYGAEALREPSEIKDAMTDGIAGIQAFLSRGVTGDIGTQQACAKLVLSILVGSILSARSARGRKQAEEILREARPIIRQMRRGNFHLM